MPNLPFQEDVNFIFKNDLYFLSFIICSTHITHNYSFSNILLLLVNSQTFSSSSSTLPHPYLCIVSIRDQGKFRDAGNLLNESLTIRENTLGMDHPAVSERVHMYSYTHIHTHTYTHISISSTQWLTHKTITYTHTYTYTLMNTHTQTYK